MVAKKIERVYDVPTRYREVVLTVSKWDVPGGENKTSARWISPSPRRRNFRVSVALTPSRKIVLTTTCANLLVESGGALNDVSFFW